MKVTTKNGGILTVQQYVVCWDLASLGWGVADPEKHAAPYMLPCQTWLS